jgi:hypothetical protein
MTYILGLQYRRQAYGKTLALADNTKKVKECKIFLATLHRKKNLFLLWHVLTEKAFFINIVKHAAIGFGTAWMVFPPYLATGILRVNWYNNNNIIHEMLVNRSHSFIGSFIVPTPPPLPILAS